ncbi:Mn(2+) transporter ATX2 [Saccharomyces eubayanus]|uniref:Mn(2+) transporter ATX2 n=1 Tax=Saccharomyces eubayanus TaxID=1080349 RepID=UPI0006BFD4BC|nr:ATX2-like protein [Saccharomyces eubayanus]KOG96586.1 ATX2-like protein [Saccharomyces eubayanus]
MNFWGVILLAGFLLIATFLIGLIPLYYIDKQRSSIVIDQEGDDSNSDISTNANMQTSSSGISGYRVKIAVLSQFGIGMLLGTSFMLVIPEGIKACVEHNGNIGLILLIGFLGVYIIDRLVTLWISGKQTIYTHDAVKFQSWKDIINHPKQIWMNLIQNNVVFALFIHGLTDGIALGTTTNNDSLLIVVLIAIVIHKVPAVLSLTSLMISRQNLLKWEVICNVFLFASSTPIGYIVLSVLNLSQSSTMDRISGYLLLMSGGSLLYASFTAFVGGGSHDHDLSVEEEVVLPHDESIYVLLGVSIPLVISFCISED